MKAKLYIPADGPFEATVHTDLPDDTVEVLGRIAAESLSDGMSVCIEFSDGRTQVIGVK